MKTLVTYASKYGSTTEIAKEISEVLKNNKIAVDLCSVEYVKNLNDYDAVVLGSAVYAGKWRKSARDFALKNANQLRQKQVWLFSSGPVGEPAKPYEPDSVKIEEIEKSLSPIGHHIFTGKLDKRQLNFAEKALINAFKVSYGDYRDWIDIKNWAETIAQEINQITD